MNILKTKYILIWSRGRNLLFAVNNKWAGIQLIGEMESSDSGLLSQWAYTYLQVKTVCMYKGGTGFFVLDVTCHYGLK